MNRPRLRITGPGLSYSNVIGSLDSILMINLTNLLRIALSIIRTFSFRKIRLLIHDHGGILIQMHYSYYRL